MSCHESDITSLGHSYCDLGLARKLYSCPSEQGISGLSAPSLHVSSFLNEWSVWPEQMPLVAESKESKWKLAVLRTSMLALSQGYWPEQVHLQAQDENEITQGLSTGVDAQKNKEKEPAVTLAAIYYLAFL